MTIEEIAKNDEGVGIGLAYAWNGQRSLRLRQSHSQLNLVVTVWNMVAPPPSLETPAQLALSGVISNDGQERDSQAVVPR